MVKFVEMDEKVTISSQMDENIGPVILINTYNVNPDDVDQFLKMWTSRAEIIKKQPGFISAQLHQGISGSSTFINFMVWESVALFKRAFSNHDSIPYPDYPAGTVESAHLFKKVAVPGICVD
jgi:quinol monooxygenase YgiN